MKKYNQGEVFRVIYTALSLVLGWFFAYFVATLVTGNVALQSLEWASVTGAAVAVAVLTWVGVTINLYRYTLEVGEGTLFFRHGFKAKAIAVADVKSYHQKKIAFGRMVLTIKTDNEVCRTIIRSADAEEITAILPKKESGLEVAVVSFSVAECLKTLWIRLILCVVVLTVVVALVIPVVWAYFSSAAAILALKVVLVAFGIGVVCLVIEYVLRVCAYTGYRLEVDGKILRRIGKFGMSESAVDDVVGIVEKENVASVLFGLKKVKLSTRADGNSVGQDFLPFYVGEDELTLLKEKMNLVAGERAKAKKTTALPMLFTMMIYFIPIVILGAAYHWTFFLWLIPAVLVIVNNCFTKSIAVGDVTSFTRGYAGKTTVTFRVSAVSKIDTASGFAAMLFKKVNLKIYLPGQTNVFYTGCTDEGYYQEIEQILQKKVDIEK